MSDDLSAVRQRVDEGHRLVRSGRYAEAGAVFGSCLPLLSAHLGPEHVEVVTLREDIETVRSMGQMSAFGRSIGMRWTDPTSRGEG